MKKSVLLITILCIIVLMYSTCFSVFAVTQDDVNNVQSKINETESERQKVEANLSSVMKEIQELEGDIAEVEFNLEQLQYNLKSLNKEITTLQSDLEKATKDYEERLETARIRTVVQYEYGNVTFLDVLLNSTSLSNFLSNYYMVEQMLDVDEDFLKEIDEEKERIENSKIELEKKKKQVEDEKQQVEKQKVALTNKKNEKDKKVSSLTAEEAALQKQKEEYYAEKSKMEQELLEIARRNSASSSGTTTTYTGGTLQFPCASFIRVSSWFGGRSSPLVGGSSYHKGLDLAAPIGASIYAAEGGTVIATFKGCTHNYGKSRSCGCGGGFGNYIMISHGNGLVTVYAHCTSVNVSVGETVSRGQVIGTVGTTGSSTGSHLHFGVMLNGSYVNPAPYIGL